jgi:ABC-2 type transport system permease protein
MKMLRDTALIFRRYLTLSLRNPVWLVVALAQPVMYLALFGPLLQNLEGVQGLAGGTAWQLLVPGLFVMLALFSAIFVGFGVIAEWRHGVTERMHVTPLSRLALLLGRILRDVAALTAQAVVLVVVGTAFGLRAPVPGVALALGLLALLTVGLTALSYTLALALKDEMALAPLLNFISIPLLLLSGVLLPMSLAPPWLDALSRADPFRYVVNGMRDAFLGHYATNAVWGALGIAVAVAVLGLAAGVRAFSREAA